RSSVSSHGLSFAYGTSSRDPGAARQHERTKTNLLRRGEGPVAAHAPNPGSQRCSADSPARVLLYNRRGKRRTADLPAAGHTACLSLGQEKELEARLLARGPAYARGANRQGAGQL